MIQGRIEMEGNPAEIGAAAGALYLGTENKQRQTQGDD
jgi:hypothetical protein